MAENEPVDYLKADHIQIPGQKYALISVVSPDSNQKSKHCGVKIRGIFEDVESAQIHAKTLQKSDPLFDVFLVEMYKWLPVPPNTDLIENQIYQDEILNTLVQGHADAQKRAKEFFEERKFEQMQCGKEPSELIQENNESSEGDVA